MFQADIRDGKNGQQYAKYEFGTFQAAVGGPVRFSGITKPEFGPRGAANSLRRDVGFWASILEARKSLAHDRSTGMIVINIPGATYQVAGEEPRQVFLQSQVAAPADVRLGVTDMARQLVNKLANAALAVIAAETTTEAEAEAEEGDPDITF